jgi:WD40 repeat protein
MSTILLKPDYDGHLLASGSHDGTVKLWDTTTRKDSATLNVGSEVGAVAFNSAGSLIASGSYDSNIESRDVHSRIEVGTLRGHAKSVLRFGVLFAWSNFGECEQRRNCEVVVVDTLQEIAPLPAASTAWSLHFSPRGRMLALGAGEVDLLIGADDEEVRRQRRP